MTFRAGLLILLLAWLLAGLVALAGLLLLALVRRVVD
jgi:hypothetical protein